jgi:hypothetical protein
VFGNILKYTQHYSHNILRISCERSLRLFQSICPAVPTHTKTPFHGAIFSYSFCRVHSSLRVTPAMAAGIYSEIWPLAAT